LFPLTIQLLNFSSSTLVFSYFLQTSLKSFISASIFWGGFLLLSISSLSDSNYLNYLVRSLASCFNCKILFSFSAILPRRSPYADYLFKNFVTRDSASETPVEILIILNEVYTIENFCISLSILSLSSLETSLLLKYNLSQLF